jgi:RNA polymerase sigma factor (sigma-70 family)
MTITTTEREAMLASLMPSIRYAAKRLFRRCWSVPLEDLEQEAAARIWNELPRFDPATAQLETWAGCRIKGAMIDAVRKQGYFLAGGTRKKRTERRVKLERRASGALYERIDESQEQCRRQADGYEGLVDLLRGLTERERNVCRLRFFEDKSLAEIGLEIGVHESYVSMLLARICEWLRWALAERQIHLREAA